MVTPVYLYVTLGCLVVLLDIYTILIGWRLNGNGKVKKVTVDDYKFAVTVFRLNLTSAVIYNLILIMVIVNHIVFNSTGPYTTTP